MKRLSVAVCMLILLSSLNAICKAEEGSAFEKPKVYKLDDLERLIMLEHNKFLKQKYVGTSGQEASHIEEYVEVWRQKVEHIGSLNFPKNDYKRHEFVGIRASVSIMANGELENVRIHQSSAYKEMNDAFIHIIKLAAPYMPFTEVMRNDINTLIITTDFNFFDDELLVGKESLKKKLNELKKVNDN